MELKRAIVFLLCSFLLTGCIRVPSLQDLAVVQGVGADYEDGRYLLTLQLLDTESADSSLQKARTVSCTGATVAEALSQTSLSQGKAFFTGHDRVLVLGEGTGELELPLLLEELSGSLGLREDVTVFVSDGKASDVLNLQNDQGLPAAMTLEQTAENASKEGKIPKVRLLEAERSLSEGDAAVLPVISLSDEAGGFKLSGAMVCREDGERYPLSGDALAGLMFFTDRVRSMNFTVDGKSVRIFQCRTKLIPQFSDGVSFLLKAEAEAMLLMPEASVSEEELERLEQLTEEKIERCCREICLFAAGKNQENILALEKTIRRKAPDIYRELMRTEEAETVKAEPDFSVEVRIRRFREN